jgi:hypothetical protein
MIRPLPSLFQSQRPALVVGHPGHELLVHGWMERAQPTVFVLTDGSGGEGQPRLASTTRVIERTGARPGAIYGAFSDKDFYTRLLDRDFSTITRLFRSLTRAFALEQIDCVVGDSAEGHNPTHDLCRLLVNAAVARAARDGQTIGNFEFPQVGRPDGSDRERASSAASASGSSASGSSAATSGAADRESIALDDEELRRKLEAAAAYPEMAAEVERALAAYGVAWCRTEWFLRAQDHPTRAHRTHAPYYETFGAKRVAEGLYSRVLRYQEHMEPVIDHLQRLACADDDVLEELATPAGTARREP